MNKSEISNADLKAIKHLVLKEWETDFKDIMIYQENVIYPKKESYIVFDNGVDKKKEISLSDFQTMNLTEFTKIIKELK